MCSLERAAERPERFCSLFLILLLFRRTKRSKDLLVIANFEGHFEQMSDSWETTLGYSKEELKEIPFIDLIHPDDLETTRQTYDKTIDGEQIGYFNDEDALLASTGLQYGLIATDIDGDGRKDLLVRKVRMSFGRVIRALLSGSVPLQLHFYRMTDDDTFAEEANYVTKTNVEFSVSSGQVDIPAIQVADFDADGLQDLMMQTDPNELSFQSGVRSSDLFAENAIQLSVALPRNGDLVSTEDINSDGRADLVIRYNESDGEERSRTVRLMLSQ